MNINHLEFELVDHDENDDKKKQRWRHKSTDRSFWVYRTIKGTGLETVV